MDREDVANMKISILTPIKKGGPYYWGKNLAEYVNSEYYGYRATHIHGLGSIMSASVYNESDIVHATIPLTYRIWRKPVILTVHGDYTMEKNVWRYLYPLAIENADAITTPSCFMKESLGLESADVIPNAVVPQRYHPVRHSDKKSIRLVTVTKFYFEDKARGVLDIIRIVESLKKKGHVNVSYTVVGGGKYLDRVKAEARKLGTSTRFTGFLSDPRTTLENSDIFLYYSTHDNFPTSILEAMASGLPVVANEVGAIGEIIENGVDGYIARSDEEFRSYISSLMEDHRLRSAIGQNARKKVEDRFSWSQVAGRYVDLYRRMG